MSASQANETGAARPRISVLMPVYNGEAYLEAQVASILAQERVDVHLVALDDGSSDGSLALLEALARQDDRIRVLRNRQNVGLMRSLARLLSNVEGDYFALADQDDLWDHDKLAQSVASLERTGAVLVYSDVRVIDAHGTVTSPNYLKSRGIRPVKGRDPTPFIFRNPAIGHTIVARASIAAEAQRLPADLVFHEAWIVGVACKAGEVTYLDGQHGSYRQHGANVVGARPPLAVRLARLFSVASPLRRRQQTRARALAAVAQLHPRLGAVAALQDRRGLARLLGAPRFAAFLLPYTPTLGLGAVLTEIALFLWSPSATSDDGLRLTQRPGLKS